MTKYHGVHMGHIIGRVIDTEYDELKDYVETVQDALKGKFETYQERAESRAEGMSSQAKERYLEDLTEDSIFILDRFPSLTWKTAFTTAYSIYEHHLLKLCGHTGRYGGFDIRVDDIKGTGIFAGQIYLKKVCQVAFPDNCQDWQDILQMNKIRNLVVHALGQLKRNSQWTGLPEYQNRKAKLIEFAEGGEIKFLEGYTLDAIAIFRRHFHAILAAVPEGLLRSTKE